MFYLIQRRIRELRRFYRKVKNYILRKRIKNIKSYFDLNLKYEGDLKNGSLYAYYMVSIQ